MNHETDPVIPAIILIEQIGIVSPNSTRLDRAVARILMTNEFYQSGISVQELKFEYIQQCNIYLGNTSP